MLIKMNDLYYDASDATYDSTNARYNNLDTSNTDVSTLLSSSTLVIEDLYKRKILYSDTTKIHSAMTSNILPSPYVASASSSYSSSYYPWYAFRGVAGNGWITANGTKTGWIQLDVGGEKTINAFSIRSRNEATTGVTATPKDFYLSGSNDGTNFTTIQTYANETGWTINSARVYELPIDFTYRYYRITVTANNGYADYTAIGDIQFLNRTIIERYYPIEKFDNFSLINSTDKVVTVKGIKSTRELIVASDSYDVREDIVHYFTDFHLVSTGNIKVAFTIDNGITWKTYVNNAWTTLAFTPPLKDYSALNVAELAVWDYVKEEIALKGINGSELSTIPWNDIVVDKVRFAYVITHNQFVDVDEVDKLNMKSEALGHLRKMKKDEYDTLKYNYGLHLQSLVNAPIIKINALLKETAMVDPSDNRPELNAPALILEKTNNIVTLTWNSILHADYYKAYVNGVCVDITNRTNTTITIEKLEGTYFFTVRAYPNDDAIYKPSKYSNMEILDYIGYLANVDMSSVDGYSFVEVIVNGMAYKFKVKNSGV